MIEANKAVTMKRYDDDNQRVYKPLRLSLPQHVKDRDLSFSIRTDTDLILEALPTKEGALIGVLLFRADDKVRREVCVLLARADCSISKIG